ncbi:MAG: hypothetical protein NC344_09780 [Bacteroidales bacterium]|nr:hypothetical protein [Bacteroidales bacterium]MCM1148093.1 hypothetical protein [Bacteroidales bacterium]MCM1509451.1 hypothetical protein [Clostridium sp.]
MDTSGDKTKTMRIVARCGNREKAVSFPVPEEMNEWMKEQTAGGTIEVEGGNSVRIFISIYDFGRQL